MKPFIQRTRRGFTLIELSIAIMLGMAIGGMVLTLFNQQLTFLRIFRAQNFLMEEAPIISMHVSRVVGKADRFRLHDSVADALAGANPRLDGSPVVLLNFRQPDGTMKATILAFQDLGTGPALYYYIVPDNGVLDAPQWSISKAPRDVQFTMVAGVLHMTLTGPYQERITYSGSM